MSDQKKVSQPKVDPPSAEKAAKVSMDKLETKCEEYLAGWKRALADYDNLKRDLGKERDEIRGHAIGRAAEGFLGVLEHFDEAMKHEPDLSSCNEVTRKQLSLWLSGVTHIRTAMVEELKTLGLEPVEPEVGTVFDPKLQESVGSRKEEDSPPDLVLEVMARGWKRGEKILHPPRVIISE